MNVRMLGLPSRLEITPRRSRRHSAPGLLEALDVDPPVTRQLLSNGSAEATWFKPNGGPSCLQSS
jgi:hypothetical protein